MHLTNALLFDLVNPHDAVHGDIGALHGRKFRFQFFLTGIYHQLGLFAEHELFYFDKAIHLALVDRAGVQLEHLILVVENDFVDWVCHRSLGMGAGNFKEGFKESYVSPVNSSVQPGRARKSAED